jgi:hypothetical protein
VKSREYGAEPNTRYQEPVNVDGRKAWRDKYINLAPPDRFSSASAAERNAARRSTKPSAKLMR